MAHFLEHMLFMGSKKYPDESEYGKYINQNSGTNNAYTTGTQTTYYLDCANEAFEGAIDRLAQFFIAPLFSESCIDREMNVFALFLI
jgi:Secreted/periplasmic Zn-dependent peptidases, insulinase-like